jgi:hypothetical protein
MSHPRYQYVADKARKTTFKLIFLKVTVKKNVAWLQLLLYPEHTKIRLNEASTQQSR